VLEFRLRRHTSPIGSYSFAWFSRVGRTNGWAKVTCVQRETLAIAGYALDGTKWDGMYIGRKKGAEFVYAGKVDHGFSPDDAKELQRRPKPLVCKTQPYRKCIAHRGIWVEPQCWQRLNARSRPKESCGTLFIKDREMT